ncbi:MAG TPA: 50S ribosomal protein L5 [Acidobacteriota bacterium]|nr:50S ribosomal protein L5 [Acidobacteriota bacterium]
MAKDKDDKKKVKGGKPDPGPPPRLRDKYFQEVAPKLMDQFGFSSLMRAPRLEKIVINQGLGEAIATPKVLESAAQELAQIAGQKAVVRRARQSISNFKLRAGMPIGCSVTLRGGRMYEFFDRLTNVALPRVRDFRGVPTKSFDGHGNYTLGVREQIIFPEIDYDKIEKVRGMNITICTTARTDEEGLALLRLMGMPFRR